MKGPRWFLLRREEERLVKALIHSVVDSYSDAHAKRRAAGGDDDQSPEDWEKSTIVRLKVWNLIATYRWQPAPDVEGYHRISDPRDDDYVCQSRFDDAACKAVRHPEALLGDGCLSPRGLGAARAVVALLLALDNVLDRKPSEPTNAIVWTKFLNDHFRLDPEVDGHDGTQLKALNQWQDDHHAPEWDTDHTCQGDCFGRCPLSADARRREASRHISIVPDPQCERWFERTTLHSSSLWAMVEGDIAEQMGAGHGAVFTTGFRLYPPFSRSNAWLSAHAALQWAPFVEASVGSLVPFGDNDIRSTALVRGRVGLISAAVHPGIALSLADFYAEAALHDSRAIYGVRIFEILLRPAGLTYHLRDLEGWQVGIGLGTAHTTSALIPSGTDASVGLSIGYGTQDRDL